MLFRYRFQNLIFEVLKAVALYVDLHESISFISLAELASALKGQRNNIIRDWISSVIFFESAFYFMAAVKWLSKY